MSQSPHITTQVYISLGGGVDLAINDKDHLVILDRAGYRIIDLGQATEKRFEDLSEYLDRLAIHAIEEKNT